MAEAIDVEKSYSTTQMVGKLRRLADALEAGKPFEIQVAGHRIIVPPDATMAFEYERTADGEELELEIKWGVTPSDEADSDEAGSDEADEEAVIEPQ